MNISGLAAAALLSNDEDSSKAAALLLERLDKAAELAVCGLDIPAPVPAVPYPSRVSVRRVEDGFSCYYGAWTCTPPILAYEGIWKVGVSLDGTTQFVPVDDVIVHGGRRG